MNLEFKSSFSRDLRRVRDSEIQDKILTVIEELEAAPNIAEILRATRIKSDKGRYYRIRIETIVWDVPWRAIHFF